MPTYRVTDPISGKTVRLTGDSPPTEQELEQVFSEISGPRGPVEEVSGPRMAMDAFNAVTGGSVPQMYDRAVAPDRAAVGVQRGVARGIGAAGKAVTDGISEVNPMVGWGAKQLLPQDEFGGHAAMLAGPMGAAVSGLAASKLGIAAGKKIAGIGGGLSEGAKTMLRYAEAKGIKLSPAEISNSPVLLAFENMMEKTPFGSEAFHGFKDKQIAAIKSLRNTLADKFGTREDAEVLDEIVKNSLRAESSTRKDAADALYGRVGELAKDAVIPMNATKRAAIELLEKELRLRPELRHNGIVDAAARAIGVEAKDLTPEMLDKIRSGWTGTLDFANFRGLQRHLGGIIEEEDIARAMGAPGVKFLGSAEAGAAKKLFKATEQDLSGFGKASGGELKKALDMATEFYAEGRGIYGNRNIVRMMKADPGTFVQTVFRPGPGSVERVRAVKTALGGDKKGFQALRRQFVESKLIPEVGDNFTPTGFQKTLDTYGEPFLREIFDGKELMQFKALAKLSERVGAAGRLQGTQGSARANTGIANTVLSSLAGTGGFVMAGPLGAAAGTTGVILGPRALSRLYLSETGRSLMMKGFTVPAGTDEAIKLTGAITAYLKAKDLDETERNP